MKRAGSGAYCAPLRLLAWEISENMNREGVPCALVTGQERRAAPNAAHDSCTVEMSDLSKVVDCAVIDEIQLLSDPLRGYAYTRALLGLPALELHLCGDPRVVPLVRRIVKSTGDLLVVKEYDRLSPLEVSRDIVKSVKDVRKGDAFVAFSRSAVYDLKRELEQKSPHRACVIYGGLPPETRSRQAELFNKPDSGYDVLIASDAIGMGLNLNIKRVIFTTMSKFDGSEMRKLAAPETRQIAGRAGRYGLNYADMGIVTTTKKADYDLLAAALEGELEPLTQAGLAPSLEQVEEYCELRPEAGLVGALQALSDSAKLAPHFRMRDMEESIAVAKLLEKLPLTLADHFLFSIAPVDIRDSMVVNAMMKFARVFCTHGRAGVRLISLPPARTPTAPHELQKLESAHKCLDLYLWLARRLPNAFPEENLADAYRTATATAISAGLQYLSLLSQKRLARAKQRRRGFSATTETADSLATPVVDALHPSAVHDAFTAVLRATKDVEDERERAGLARIDAAERKAASSAESAWTRNAQRKPGESPHPSRHQAFAEKNDETVDHEIHRAGRLERRARRVTTTVAVAASRRRVAPQTELVVTDRQIGRSNARRVAARRVRVNERGRDAPPRSRRQSTSRGDAFARDDVALFRRLADVRRVARRLERTPALETRARDVDAGV